MALAGGDHRCRVGGWRKKKRDRARTQWDIEREKQMADEQQKSACSPFGQTQPGSLNSIGNPFYLMTGRQLGLLGDRPRLCG